MAGVPGQANLQQRLAQQLLGPLDDAVALARRYREVDAFHDYVVDRARLVVPAVVLIGIAAVACGLAPVMALVGTRPIAALGVLLGSLFVLGLVFFSWLEERSLARSLGHRAGGREPKAVRWIRKKLGADLGRPPRVPWLLALVFVALPFVMLANLVPVIAAILLVLLAAAPLAFARLDR
jgi:hypothetical protein